MLDRDIEKIVNDEGGRARESAKKLKEMSWDEVSEASDSSFPASDPPAYTSAAPREAIKLPRKKA